MALVNDLLIRLGWDGTAAKRGMAEAKHDAEKTAHETEGILGHFQEHQERWLVRHAMHAAGVAEGYHKISEAIEKVVKVGEGAEKSGLSPEGFQALEYAAEQAGVPIEKMLENVKDLPDYIQKAMIEWSKSGRGFSNGQVDSVMAARRNLRDSGESISQLIIGGPAGLLRQWGINLPEWLDPILGQGISGAAKGFNTAVGGIRSGLSSIGIGHYDPAAEAAARERARAARAADEAWSEFEGDFWDGFWDADANIKRRKSRLDHAMNLGGSFSSEASSAANKIGGFGYGGDPGVTNILNAQVRLLERIEQALKESPPL